jgi:hypothetical protein
MNNFGIKIKKGGGEEEKKLKKKKKKEKKKKERKKKINLFQFFICWQRYYCAIEFVFSLL